MDNEYLALKWGTLKGWKIDKENNPASWLAIQKYFDTGKVSSSSMTQVDNDSQKEAILELIEAINGEIYNDYSGENYTKEEAKKYIMEYK